MKLRIRGNSIRLRLGPAEVLRLLLDGTLEEATDFGPFHADRFNYALHTTDESFDVSASFAGGRMVVRVPKDVIDRWATSGQVSIDALQRTGDGGDLRILIEKDFQCIDPPIGESEADTFPNPQFTPAGCAPGKIN